MKATDIWKAKQSPSISFELFPAKSEKAAVSLAKTIDTLAALLVNIGFRLLTGWDSGRIISGTFGALFPVSLYR